MQEAVVKITISTKVLKNEKNGTRNVLKLWSYYAIIANFFSDVTCVLVKTQVFVTSRREFVNRADIFKKKTCGFDEKNPL